MIFAVDDLDDFEEACQAMYRWQPDHYAEVIANMASRSRRKINDIAVKVRVLIASPHTRVAMPYCDRCPFQVRDIARRTEVTIIIGIVPQ